MSRVRHPGWLALLALALVMVLLAFARPLDHDESQYVAAAMLARHGLVYRDFAYLQTPLQPILFAPLAMLFGGWIFPGLRLVNALLGVATAATVHRAARTAGAAPAVALGTTALLTGCDIFLFSADVARNDMLPALLFALALIAMIRLAAGQGGRGAALLAGLLLSAATAAKLSYALPALAFGGLALIDRRYRPGWVLLGAVPPALLVAATWAAAPAAFAFDVLRFPTAAPEQFYAAGRAWKLALWARALDTLKFLALGGAPVALVVVARARSRERVARLLDLMIVAGIVAALLPAPTWRQYLLPVLPPLFVRLAMIWQAAPPGSATRRALVPFVVAGIAPSAVMLGSAAWQGLPLAEAISDGAAVRRAMDDVGVAGPVATLSPQFVPATGRAIDRRFAAGPFYYRSTGLLAPGEASAFHLVDRAATPAALAQRPPAAILTGGEGAWTGGDDALDRSLATIAGRQGWRPIRVPATPFTLYVRP